MPVACEGSANGRQSVGVTAVRTSCLQKRSLSDVVRIRVGRELQLHGSDGLFDSLLGLSDSRLTLRRTHAEPFGGDDVNGGDANESERTAQVRVRMFHDARRGAFAIEATARDGQDDLLVAGQALRLSGLVVAECLAGDGNPIDPGLELGGN